MTAAVERKTRKGEQATRPPGARMTRWTAWVILGLLLVVSLFPFWWAFRTAMSENSALFTGAQSLLPVETTTLNFERVLGLEPVDQGGATFDFPLLLRNSVIVATVVTFFQVLFSAMAAYAFARLEFPFRNQIFFVYLAGLMVPPIFTLIPNFILIKNLGLLNTLPGIMAPFLFMTPFAVFFLRQFFLGINKELEEAAAIDGAGRWRTFFQLVIPVASAPIFTLAILTYITSWNEYLWPLVVGREESVRVLTVALGIFTTQQPGTSPDWAGLMAATFLAASPIILLFLIMGRRVVDSIQFSGIK